MGCECDVRMSMYLSIYLCLYCASNVKEFYNHVMGIFGGDGRVYDVEYICDTEEK